MVQDPFQVTTDPKMPWLAKALDAEQVLEQFRTHLRPIHFPLQLLAIRVVRYKPGRRCLIEYDVAFSNHSGHLETLTLMGKVRAKGLDYTSYQVLHSLWHQGFSISSPDGSCVPKPVGKIPAFKMWLQHKMPGELATHRFLATAHQPDLDLCHRIAQAAHKLHQVTIPAPRQHAMVDELMILRDRLGQVAQRFSHWQERLMQILVNCDRIAATVPTASFKPIHRDFYPDQILITDDYLCLLDFDLFCYGDPALDIGNFIGHLSELSLRTFGNPDVLKGSEQAIIDQFVWLSGEHTRHSIAVYAILTLVRHIYISTLFVERAGFTEAIMRLCEEQLETI